MTCIAGVIGKDKRVWIGADSAGVAGTSLRVRADEKVFCNGDFVFGFTTSFRMGQLLRYSLVIPPMGKISLQEFMHTVFVNAVRACLKRGGYTTISNNCEEGGKFLVGGKGKLFTIGSDFQIGETACGYNAVGCGGELAMGSLYTSLIKLDPKRRILLALAAAEAFSSGVRRPFKIRSVG